MAHYCQKRSQLRGKFNIDVGCLSLIIPISFSSLCPFYFLVFLALTVIFLPSSSWPVLLIDLASVALLPLTINGFTSTGKTMFLLEQKYEVILREGQFQWPQNS
jgi:hypothetical protein